MPEIKLDEDVYNALKNLAEPFVDTPNSVLRRLLKLEPNTRATEAPIRTTTRPPLRHAGEDGEVRTKHFVEKVLSTEFGRDFQRRGRFTYMFENRRRLVYFQNFNAAYENSWYRISPAPRQELEHSDKETFLCLTVPADGEYYLIPYGDIMKQVGRRKWQRPELEVNIDRVRSIWRELKWDISSYKKKLTMTNGGAASEAEDKQ